MDDFIKILLKFSIAHNRNFFKYPHHYKIMIFSDRDIQDGIGRGDISIEPFDSKNLTPNGYDLSIGEIFIGGKRIGKGKAKIPPLTWFVIGTKEMVKIKNIAAQLWIRSSYARKGIMTSFGKVDAGFEGNLTICCFNAYKDIDISIGDRFCQIVFEEMKSEPEKFYEERSGRYQGQRGIRFH